MSSHYVSAINLDVTPYFSVFSEFDCVLIGCIASKNQ